MSDLSNIRNFCIIAHIDHGKSTLADRLLELTGAVTAREFRDQFLDANEIERERGVTIKAKAITLAYQLAGKDYQLNLIDTPGHVDFSYEVLRSLKACEGALLVVDATQGVEAQTVANTLLARQANLHIIPLINKIDSGAARPDEVSEEMAKVLDVNPQDIIPVSAKAGTNVAQVLEAVVKRIPAPQGDIAQPLQALIFDSVYNEYRGVIVYVRVINGRLKKGDEIRMTHANRVFQVEEVGRFRPKIVPTTEIHAGEVGYVIAGVKNIRDVHIGDTITQAEAVGVKALPGYQEPLPMVFAGFYPAGETDFNQLKKAVERLGLNDASFTYETETSEALGFGFRCGFLGLFHMEIIKERLEKEESVEVLRTAPNVTYEVVVRQKGQTRTLRIDNPAKMPDESELVEIREPIVRLNLIIPSANMGALMQLCENRRGVFIKTSYISTTRAMLVYDLPLAEVIYDFYDKLKSATRGYGTMDYSFMGYRTGELVKLRILVASKEVDALSSVVHQSNGETRGREIIKVLRQQIPRQLFEVALQASIGKRIVARESIKPFAKHVTGKCYGGDITRKRKLWAKQKLGKKKMKSIGQIDIPQEAFMAVLTAPAK
jgi:GTP-binding protein LepA